MGRTKRDCQSIASHERNTILKDISIEWNCEHEDGNEEETLIPSI